MRLFVAIPLVEAARDRLDDLCEGLRVGRWIDPENFHITLKFLGEVDRNDAQDLDAALDGIRAPAFEVNFDGLGTFERKGRVHTLYVGVEKTPEIKHLRDKVERACQQAGFEAEGGRFTPHVSLARFRKPPAPPEIGAWMRRAEPFTAGPYAVDRFTLFRSHLGSQGASYDPLMDYGLLGGGFADEMDDDDVYPDEADRGESERDDDEADARAASKETRHG